MISYPLGTNAGASWLMNLHAVFHNACTGLHLYQECFRVHFSSDPYWNGLLFEFWMTDILSVIFNCLFLIASEPTVFNMSVDHLYFILGKIPVPSFVHLLTGFFVFVEFLELLTYFCINPLSDE